VGALEDAGVDRDTAQYYDERFKQGGYLLTVRTNDMEYDKARMILQRHDGDVRGSTATTPNPAMAAGTTDTARPATMPASATTAGWDTAMPGYRNRWQERYGTSGGRWEDVEPAYRYGYEMRNNPAYRGRTWTEAEPELRRDWESRHHDRPWDRVANFIRDTWDEKTDHDQSVQLKEERLRPEKESVKAGEVALRKDVVTEQKSVDVPVTHEEVVVERRPVEGRRPATGDVREGEEVRVPVQEEKVRLEKQPVVTEEVRVEKRPVTETEHVTGTVRREEARAVPTGDVDVRDDKGTTRPGEVGTPGAVSTPGLTHQHTFVEGRCECGARKV